MAFWGDYLAKEDLTRDVHVTPDALSGLVQLTGPVFAGKMYNGPHSENTAWSQNKNVDPLKKKKVMLQLKKPKFKNP